MENRIKIALIGCGHWGKNILRDLKTLGCHVIVVSNSESGNKNALEGGADRLESNIDNVGMVQGFVVAVNTKSHYSVLIKIIHSFGDVPIYCEKPLCTNGDEAKELVRLAADRLFVMHKWRYHEGILALSRIEKENKLGSLKGAKFIRNGWGINHSDVDCTWILLPHDLSMCLEIFGYIPEPVFAVHDKVGNKVYGMTGTLRSNRHWVNVEISERYPGHKREIHLFFEKGVARLTDAHQNILEIYPSHRIVFNQPADPQIIKFKNELPLFRELDHFISYIKGNREAPKSTSEEGMRVVSTIEKLNQIAKNNHGKSS
jgi:predicted dehydrogenase